MEAPSGELFCAGIGVDLQRQEGEGFGFAVDGSGYLDRFLWLATCGHGDGVSSIEWQVSILEPNLFSIILDEISHSVVLYSVAIRDIMQVFSVNKVLIYHAQPYLIRMVGIFESSVVAGAGFLRNTVSTMLSNTL